MSSQKRAQFDSNGKRLRARAGRPWKNLRAYCWTRELACNGGTVRCYLCDADVTGASTSEFNVDHILPKSLDFDALEYEAGNVDILCFRCNNVKDADRLDAAKELAVLTEVARKNALMGRDQTTVADLLRQFPNPGA